MKKIVLIFLCLMLAVAVVLPTVAFADTANSLAEDIIYFLNPTAITTVGDYLFVADKIEDNRSAIICFDVSANAPIRVSTFELDEKILNLSDDDNDKLYAVTDTRVLMLTWDENEREISATDTSYAISGRPAIDFAHGVFHNGYNEYYLTENQLYRIDDTQQPINITDEFDSTVACYALDNFVYYIYSLDGQTYCKRYDGTKFTTETSDKFNSSLDLLGMTPLGFFEWDNSVAIFGSNLLLSIEVTTNACTASTLISLYNQTDDVIMDVTACNDKIFVLNNRNVVEIYTNDTDGWKNTDTIGSDILNKAVPVDYTSFTLVKTKGYPANIVFRTLGDDSVNSIITTASEYIVLGFDGEATSNFYYVFVRDDNGNYKFGWVKKSDTATSVQDDDKLQVVNTKWSNDSNVQYKTAFSSLNAVWIYDVPCSQYDPHSITQTASNMTEVTVLQEFAELTADGEVAWLYVEYENGDTTERGFVKMEDIGSFYPTVTDTTVIAYRKINSSLFSSVRLYQFGEAGKMTDEYLAVFTKTVTDADGEKIVVEETVPPLYSGQKVSVISEENGVALVQILRGDGATAYGYVYSNQLIDAHAITTNATVGLVLLAIAIALAVVLIVVFVRRKQKNSSVRNKNRKEK